MELHSIDTLSEGWEDDPRVLIVHVTVKPPYDYNPENVIKYATTVLEAWGEEVVSARLYSIQPAKPERNSGGGGADDVTIIGISCEV